MTLAYPQLGSGALGQFPVRKTRRTRTVTNRAADGSAIKLADPAGLITEWSLRYTDLSDEEAAALEAFFKAAEGSLNSFTFTDPAGNLLACSDQLDGEVWQKDPMLSLSGGVTDPWGGTRAWRIVNGGAAKQSIAQTIGATGAYQYCASAYLRGIAPTRVRVWAGRDSINYDVTPSWRRVQLGTSSPADAESLRFGIEAPEFATIEACGTQVEAQPGASGYNASIRGGVYEGAHLRDDALAIVRTGVNRNSCTVNIIHANHL